MGLIRAFTGALSGTLADQWKDIITSGAFDNHTVVVPSIRKTQDNGRGNNYKGSSGVISNGTKIYVPENTACVIFSESGIEEIVTETGGYEYQNGAPSIFSGDGLNQSIIKEFANRFKFGGISDMQKEVVFVNLREIRDIKFGTRGPQVYNDLFYGCDFEIYAYGSFTIKIRNVAKFILNYLPANVTSYSLDEEGAREQLISDFIQSFIVAINSLSNKYRISQLPSQANALSDIIKSDPINAGTWNERFGFEIVKVSIENIEFSPESRELVNKYNSQKMNLSAYEEISQKAANIAAQQKIAQGVENHGFGDVGGMILGANMAGIVNASGQVDTQKNKSSMSFDEQIETIKKLKDLLDIGILTQEEFDMKKKEIMGL